MKLWYKRHKVSGIGLSIMHYFDYWTGRYILRSKMIMFNGGVFTFKIYYKFIT